MAYRQPSLLDDIRKILEDYPFSLKNIMNEALQNQSDSGQDQFSAYVYDS